MSVSKVVSDKVRGMIGQTDKTQSGANSAKDLPKDETTVLKREVLLKWSSPMRYFKPMDKKKYFTIMACVLAFFVILAILGQFWLMAAIASVMFLLYVVGTVPPVKVDHEFTSIGIETMGVEYKWKELTDYWFSKKDDQVHLNVGSKLKFPARLIILVNKDNFDQVDAVLSKRLKYKDYRKQSAINKIIEGEWINKLGKEDEEDMKR
ncbi:MAG: hypothetical protein U9Q67_00680 [Patescibacteria group bacterium]|nr:hypothetical protein [Patescibacteria group bacterium]